MGRLPPSELSAEEFELRRRDGRPAPNLQLATAHAPEVARSQFELIRAAAAGMSPRQKELIILAVGLLTHNAYCWGHHVPPAIAAGISEAEIRAIRSGDYSRFDGRERTLLNFCAAVVEERVDDSLWADICGGRTFEELVKITTLVGFYVMSGKVQAVFQIDQDVGFGGFEQP